MEIVFLFYPGMTALDAIGPYEILNRLPGASVKSVAPIPGKIKTDSGLILFAEHSLSEVKQADVLLVPGAGTATSLKNFPETLAWLRAIHATTKWTTSVCTGSLILGATGILSGLKATSHWAVMDRLPGYGAEPVHARVVECGKVMTAAGVSAGIDMGLQLAAKLAGEFTAKAIQLGIEYDPEPPFNAGSPEKAGPEIVAALRKRMASKFETE